MQIFKNCLGEQPPEPFSFSIRFKIILPKTNTLENMSKFGVLALKKFLNMWQRMKTFFKGLFTFFSNLTSLHLVNIRPNSKFQPPQQNFLNPVRSAISRLFLEPPFEICWVDP